MSFSQVNGSTGSPLSTNNSSRLLSENVFTSPQRETPLSQEEVHILSKNIQDFSLLNENQAATNVLGPKGNIHLGLKDSPLFLNLAHLFAHPWLNLPGVKPPSLHNGIQLAKAFFSRVPSAGIIFEKLTKLSERIENTKHSIKDVTDPKQIAHSIKQAALETAKEVKALGNNEDYYIPIQYHDPSTDSVYPIFVCFKRTDLSKFDITLWSTNRNTSSYQNFQVENAEEKIKPIIKFTNIESSDLFFDDDGKIRSDFFEALLQTSLVDKPELKLILEGIFKKFWPHYDQKQSEANFISAQKAHESNWSLLKALGYHAYNDKAAYKVDKLRFLTKALVEAWIKSENELSQNSKGASDCRQVLRDAAKHLQKLAYKSLEKGQIDENEIRQIRVTSQDIIERLDRINEKINKEQKTEQIPITPQSVLLNTHLSSSKKTIESINLRRPQETSKPAQAPLFTTQKFVLPDNRNEIAQALKASLDRITPQAIIETPLAVISQVEQILETFKLDQNWSNIDVDNLASIISHLDTMGTNYLESIKNLKISSQAKHSLTFDKMYALTHALTLIYDHKSGKNTGIDKYICHYEMLENKVAEVEFDPQTAQEKKAIHRYFRNKGLDKIKGHFSSFGGIEKMPDVIFNFKRPVVINDKEANKNDGKFYLELAKSNTNVAVDYAKNLKRNPYQNSLHNSFPHLHHLRNAALRSQLFQEQRYIHASEKNSEIFWNGNENRNSYYATTTISYSLMYSWTSHYKTHTETNELFDMGKLPSSDWPPERTYSIDGNILSLLKNNTSPKNNNKHESSTLLEDHFDQFNRVGNYPATDLGLSLAEKQLLPFQILDHFIHNIRALSSANQQALFEILFFRVYTHATEQFPQNIASKYYDQKFLTEDTWQTIDWLLQNEPALRDRCKDFIDHGIERYVELQTKKRPQVDAALFFMRFAAHLHKRNVYDAAPFITSINQWLELEDLTPDEKYTLHQHRLYLYSIIKSEQYDKAIESWCFLNQATARKEWNHPYLNSTTEQYAQKCVQNALEEYPDNSWEKISRHILSSHHLIDPNTPLKVDFKFSGILTATTPGGDEWNIHLSNGKIKHFEEEISGSIKNPWDNNDIKTVSEALGENPKNLTYIGKSARYFSDKLGLILFPQNSPKNYIQREINGKWYQYHPIEKLKEGNIPKSLLNNNTAWVSLERPREVVYSSKQTGKPLYIQFENGNIHPANDKTITLHPYIPLEGSNGLELVEDPTYILVEENPQGQIVGYNLPRFNARFIAQDGEIFLDKYPQYVLAPTRQNNLLFGNNNYLTLINKYDGSTKILCSNRNIVKAPGTKIARISQKFPQSASFVMFNYENDLVKPQSLSERILLANILLGQGEYLKANKLLEAIEPTETIDYNSIEYLDRIISYAENYDHSVEAAALGLKATYILLEAKTSLLNPNLSPVSDILIENYYRNLKRLSSLLELSDRAEKALLKNVFLKTDSSLSTIIESRRALLNKASIKHTSSIPNIHHLNTLRTLQPSNLWSKNLDTQYGSPAERKKAEDDVNQLLFDYRFLLPDNESTLSFKEYSQPILFTRSVNDSLGNGGWRNMFYAAYEVATRNTHSQNSGELAAENRRLEFRLQMWETNSENYNNALDKDLFAYLQTAIHPNARVPKSLTFSEKYYFPREGKARNIWNFIKELYAATDSYFKNLSLEWQSDVRGALIRNIDLTKTNKVPPIIRKGTEKALKPQDKTLTFPILPSSLEGLRNTYVPALKEQTLPATKPTELFKPPFLDPSEKSLEEAIQTGFDEFNDDYKAGKIENIKAENQPIEPEINPDIFATLNGIISVKKAENENRINTLLNLANKTLSEQQRAKREASLQQPLVLADLHHLFNQKSREQYRRVNPNLTDDEITQAYKLTAEQMQTGIEIRKLEQIKALETKLQAAVGEARQNILREIRSLIRPLQEVYDPLELPTALVFEYMSKLTPRPKQVEHLKTLSNVDSHGNYISRIVQLIMGGGKTAVLSSVLLSQAARFGRRSILIVPPEQLGSVKANLRKSQRQNFNQGVIALEYSPDQLNSIRTLEEIIDRLDQAEKKGDVILMTPNIMEFLWAYLKKECLEPGASQKKIALMADICNDQREKGDALADEVDQVLNLGYAVDIPGNEPKKLKFERVILVELIYKYFNSESLKIKGADGIERSVKELVNLKENKQKALSKADFNEVYSQIVLQIVKNHPTLRLHKYPKFHASFARYATNSINSELQRYYDNNDEYANEIQKLQGTEKDDFIFLQYFNKLKNSKREEEKEAADEIALLAHLHKDILPNAFSEDAGRNFGRLGLNIVPYEGAGNPALTEIGYHYRKLILWFQNLFSFPPGKEQILYFAEKMHEKAEHEVIKTKKLLNDTPSGIEFRNTTGINISDIDNPKAIESAVKFVQAEPLHALRVEREIALENVTYYPERYTANGLTLSWLFSTFRGFSGTPWNYLTFISKLVKTIVLDVGTEGSIIDKLFQREANGEVPIHITTNNDPEHILGNILKNNANKERIVGLLDAGALSKHISPNEVPKHIWKFYNPPADKEGKITRPIERPINHIFYLHHPGGNGTPVPCVYSEAVNGTPIRTFLDGTQLEDFTKAGVDINRCFYLINEKGCTGTDVVQPDDAINIMSVDENMLRRTFFQTVFRLRKILLKQNIEIVINEASVPKIDQKATSLRALMNTFILRQASELSKRVDEAFQYNVDFFFESAIMTHFVLKPRKEGKSVQTERLAPYKEFLCSTIRDNPSDDFGKLQYHVNTKEDLVNYAINKLNLLKGIPDVPSKLIRKVQKQIDDIIEDINKSKHLADTKLSNQTKGLNVQTTIVQQTNRTTNTERTVEVQKQVELELNRYNIHLDKTPRAESIWKNDDIENFLKNPTGSPQIISLHDALDKNKSKLAFTYAHPYKNIFGNKHFATSNFIHTHSTILPIFHRGFKRFHQILFIETRTGMVSVQLSKQEAVQFINYLRGNNSHPNVWIVNPEGKPYYQTDKPLPENAAVKQTLVEVNAANGNMSYLDAHDEDTSIWMNTNCTHENPCTCFETKKIFVTLKVCDKPLQNEIFNRSEIFHPNLFPTNNQRLRLNPQSIPELDSPDEIELLKIDQVNHLTHKPVFNLDELQTYYLTPQQIGWLKKPELIATLTPQQFEHLSYDQMVWISKHQVPWIGNKTNYIHALVPPLLDSLTSNQLALILDEQVPEIQLEQTLALLNDDKIKHITKSQVALITQQRLLERVPSQWKWINEAQVKAGIVSDEMIPFLEDEKAIQALPIEKMHLVPTELRHKYISDAQLQIVHTNMTVFNNLDKTLINRIHNEAAILAMPLDYIPHMSEHDFKHLSKEQVEQLTDATVLQKLPTEKVQHVALSQIEKLNPYQSNFLSKTQILSLKDQRFICRLNNEGKGYLTENQIALITDPYAITTFVNWIPTELLPKLTSLQIKYVSNDLVDQIPKKRWPELTVDQLNSWKITYEVSRYVKDSSFFTYVDFPKAMRAKGSFLQKAFSFPYRTLTGILSATLSTAAIFTPIFWFRNYSFMQPVWKFLSHPVKRLFT